jgi:hypothetical protein
MSWFEDYVVEAVSDFPENRISVIAGIQKGLSTTEIGQIGEEFVQYLMTKQDYEAVLSPGSRTPADVWAFRNFRHAYHVALIQVKTAFELDEPEFPNFRKSQTREFLDWASDILLYSEFVPQKIQEKPFLFSYGYAGVVLDELEPEPIAHIHSARLIQFIYEETLEGRKDRDERFIKMVHEFDIEHTRES